MTTVVVFTAYSLAELAWLDEAADSEMRSPEAAVALFNVQALGGFMVSRPCNT